MYERTYQKKVLSRTAPAEPPKKKRRRRIPWRFIMRIVIGVMVVAGVVVLIRLPQLRVTQIDVVGTKVVDPEAVTQFVQSQIDGNFLYVFPKASMLLVPTASITKWTARQFPRFATVDVRRKGVNGLIVTVTEHDGKYLWCQDAATPGDNPNCFFMNADGLVFAPAPFFSGDAYVKLFIGTAQALPFSPITAAQLTMVQTLLDRLPSLGINPIAIRTVSEHEIEVSFSHHGTPAKVWFDPSEDVTPMLERLATALGTDPLKSEFATPAKTLEYLDVRFANKVVFKFQ